MASHELRNLLHALKLQAHLARAPLDSEPFETAKPKLNTLLSSAEKGVDKLASIINNLLDLFGIEDGKTDFPLEQHDLVELVVQVVKSLEQKRIFRKSERIKPLKVKREKVRYSTLNYLLLFLEFFLVYSIKMSS